jgi:molecular chaperone DnaK
MKERFKDQHGIDLPVQSNSSLRALLRKEAERAKEALSSETEVALSLPNLFTIEDRSLNLEATLTRAEFEALIWPLINRSLDICDKVLKDAKLSADQINQVLLVGGQTRTPFVRKALHSRYGWRLNDSVNPDEAVAQGAAVLGARLCGHLKQQVNLWDVIPQSLGIRLADEKIDRIISANAQIPVKVWRKEAFTTYRDGQERIRFEIYQGEKETAKENTFIGDVVLNLTTTRRASEHRISCMFEVDRDGILHVRAEEADIEGNPIEATFDRIYKATQEDLDQSIIDNER